jgi:hypothetical protein
MNIVYGLSTVEHDVCKMSDKERVRFGDNFRYYQDNAFCFSIYFDFSPMNYTTKHNRNSHYSKMMKKEHHMVGNPFPIVCVHVSAL